MWRHITEVCNLILKKLTAKHLLISQPQPSSDRSPFAELVGAHNAQIDFRPFITVEGVSLKEFIAQRVKILDHSAIIFTSRTLIDNFFRLVGESRLVVPDSMKYFCISESIANYLQKYIVYRKRKIFFGEGSITSLLEVILKHGTENFLLPLSEPHKPEIPLALSRAALKHTKVIFSHARCSDLSDIDPNAYDIVALYSPTEIEAYERQILDRGYKGRLAVFGTSVVRAVMERGIKLDIMAPTDKYPSMSAALAAYIESEKRGEDLSVFAPCELPKSNQDEIIKLAERRRPRARKLIAASVAAKK